MTLSANIQGTVGHSSVEVKFGANDARRADFVPKRPLTVELECLGTATNLFHSFDNIRCSWPPSGSSGAQVLVASGSLPDIRKLDSATFNVSIPGIPADVLVNWLHVINERVPADVSMAGTLTGSLAYHPGPSPLPSLDGAIFVTGAKLMSPGAGSPSLLAGDVAFHSVTQPGIKARPRTKHALPRSISSTFVLAPTEVALGGKEPAMLEGRFDATGYTLHLTGMALPSRLLALGTALPEFGDGLANVLPPNHATGPLRIDLTAVRPWAGAQVWTAAPAHPVVRHSRRARRP
jgi:AsmA protein